MVAFTTLLTAVAAIAGSASVVSAEYLAVLKEVSQSGGGPQSPCRKNAPFYAIYSWSEQTPKGISGCSGAGKTIASSKNTNGSKLEGCHGGYTNGYSVCITSYGGNIHKNRNGRNQHQRCVNDNKQMTRCPSGYCYDTSNRVLMCDGVWRDD